MSGEIETGNRIILTRVDDSGNLCGDRSGEVTMVEPNDARSPVTVLIMTQSDEWRYNIGVSQVNIKKYES